jgi:hypothetical protein
LLVSQSVSQKRSNAIWILIIVALEIPQVPLELTVNSTYADGTEQTQVISLPIEPLAIPRVDEDDGPEADIIMDEGDIIIEKPIIV